MTTWQWYAAELVVTSLTVFTVGAWLSNRAHRRRVAAADARRRAKLSAQIRERAENIRRINEAAADLDLAFKQALALARCEHDWYEFAGNGGVDRECLHCGTRISGGAA